LLNEVTEFNVEIVPNPKFRNPLRLSMPKADTNIDLDFEGLRYGFGDVM